MNRFTPTVLDAPSSIHRLQDGELEQFALVAAKLGEPRSPTLLWHGGESPKIEGERGVAETNELFDR